jgi:hypothetical protein
MSELDRFCGGFLNYYLIVLQMTSEFVRRNGDCSLLIVQCNDSKRPLSHRFCISVFIQ